MSEKTGVEWADHTFSPWWGCAKVSEACRACYAEAWARWRGKRVWGKDAPRPSVSDETWRNPVLWNAKAARASAYRRVFSGSMCDVFEERDLLGPHRARLFDLVERTPHLIWMFLTKRPENIRRMVPGAWLARPRTNVWYGATVELARHMARADHLLDLPAALRFLSSEPLLGPLDYGSRLGAGRIGWVIAGGESGPGARPTDPDHVRAVRDQAARAGIPFFFKQWGEWAPRTAMKKDALAGRRRPATVVLAAGELVRAGKAKTTPLLDGRFHAEVPDPSACARDLTTAAV